MRAIKENLSLQLLIIGLVVILSLVVVFMRGTIPGLDQGLALLGMSNAVEPIETGTQTTLVSLTADIRASRWFSYGLVAGVLLLGLALAALSRRGITTLSRSEGARQHSATNQAGGLTAVTDSLISIDAESRILEFNPVAERLFGFRPFEVLGRSLGELITPWEDHHQRLSQYITMGESTPLLATQIKASARRSNNSEFPIEFSIIRAEADGPPSFTVILRPLVQSEPEVVESTDPLLTVEAALNRARDALQERSEELEKINQTLHMEIARREQLEQEMKSEAKGKVRFRQEKNRQPEQSEPPLSSSVIQPGYSGRVNVAAASAGFSGSINDFVTLRYVMVTALRWWWLLILAVVVLADVGYLISRRQTPVYEATTTLMVGQILQSTELNRVDIQTSQVLASIYADMVQREPVLQRTIDELGLAESWLDLKERVDVDLKEGAQLFAIQVEAGSPQEAEETAAEIAQQIIYLSPAEQQSQVLAENRSFLRQRVEQLQAKIETGQAQLNDLEVALAQSDSPEVLRDTQNKTEALENLIGSWEANYTQMLALLENNILPNSLAVIEPAQAQPDPIRPRPLVNTIIAAAVGLSLALSLIFLLEYWDDTLKSAEELSRVLGVRTLGIINRIKGKSFHDRLLYRQDAFSPVTESYRMMRSNIQFLPVSQPVKSLMITSPCPGEGKSTTVANLGIILAQAGFKTIIVDADLRRPKQHDIFQVQNQIGLTELLSRPEFDPKAQLRDTYIINLQLLPSGTLPRNPAELLGSQYMGRVLSTLNDLADVVIYDSPAALPVTDAAVLSSWVDGVIMVTEAARTRRGALEEAVSRLQQVGATILGGVLNGVVSNRDRYDLAGYYTPIKPQTASLPASTRPWR